MADWYRRNSEQQKLASKLDYEANKAARLDAMAVYRAANRDAIKTQISAYRKTGAGFAKKAAYDREYRAKHPEVVAAASRRYRLKNPEKISALVQRRRADRLRAVNLQDMEFLALVSVEAQALARIRAKITGVPWEVDHVVPLRGRLSSGLHNPFNLQVIPRSVNRRKSNKLGI